MKSAKNCRRQRRHSDDGCIVVVVVIVQFKCTVRIFK